MRITLNLAARPYTDFTPTYKRLQLAIVLLVLLAIVFGYGLYAFHEEASQARVQEHNVDLKIAALNRERQSFQRLMAQPQNKLVLAQVATLNNLFDEKGFSWTLAVEDLETVLPAGVQVATLEPARDKTGKITLRMRVLGPRDKAVELVQNLERSRRFLAPRIVGENAEEIKGRPGQPLEPVSASSRVAFEVLADYNPVTQSEIKRHPKAAPAAESEPKSQASAPRSRAASLPTAPLKLQLATGKAAQKPSADGPVLSGGRR